MSAVVCAFKTFVMRGKFLDLGIGILTWRAQQMRRQQDVTINSLRFDAII
jgi:hypothetical protein